MADFERFKEKYDLRGCRTYASESQLYIIEMFTRCLKLEIRL